MPTADFFTGLGRLLASACSERFSRWGAPELSQRITLDRPSVRDHGDLAMNIAMVAAGAAGRPPRELAGELAGDIRKAVALAPYIESVDIAGPGFINLFLTSGSLARAALEALARGPEFGGGTAVSPERILLEFVSANPTGPLHVGHARYAAYGDSLRRILSFAGHQVTTEFYVNDYGTQMELFGRSLASRYGELAGVDVGMPEDGYRGDYTAHIAGLIFDEAGDRMVSSLTPEPSPEAIAYFRERGCELVLEEVRSVLSDFRVSFDVWFSETSLYSENKTGETLEILKAAGETMEKEGALWLLTTRYGDDKDRVLVRGSGDPTYFASDIAYHRDKLARGFDRLIDIWGADHHGYVPRMKAAFEALSHDPGRMEIIIGQLVNVLEMGERKQMSKRAGTMVTLEELLDSIGVDAARFFLVDRSHDSALDLDLEKARLQSEENPVYYVQYAHARICSILRRAAEEGIPGESPGAGPGTLAKEEKELVLKLLEFPGTARLAADSRSPNRITAYARELAATFHIFYHNCPVIRAPADTASFRLDLCRLTGGVIASCLDLVGVSAPESM